MTSATVQARADVDDVSERLRRVEARDLKQWRMEVRGARDQQKRAFEQRMGAYVVSNGVKALMNM